MASFSVKTLTVEIEALLSEKNAGYTEYQEQKRRGNDLLTIKRNIDQVLHGASSQQRDEHDPNAVFIVSGFFERNIIDIAAGNTAITAPDRAPEKESYQRMRALQTRIFR